MHRLGYGCFRSFGKDASSLRGMAEQAVCKGGNPVKAAESDESPRRETEDQSGGHINIHDDTVISVNSDKMKEQYRNHFSKPVGRKERHIGQERQERRESVGQESMNTCPDLQFPLRFRLG